MPELIVFTDSSVNPQTQVGYGAYLALAEFGLSPSELLSSIKLRRFEQTSSTRLELQTLLWALGELPILGTQLRVYTDSQNIIGLPGRRARLEQNGYRSRNKKRLANYLLYQEFYRFSDSLDCQWLKVCGHQLSEQKNDIARLFTLVDRAARQALRAETCSKFIKL